MMILRLDYVFAPFFGFLALLEVDKGISFSKYFIRRTCWIVSSSFKYKNTENEPNMMFCHKTIFFLVNLNDTLKKNRCHIKIILDNAVFQLLSESTFA